MIPLAEVRRNCGGAYTARRAGQNRGEAILRRQQAGEDLATVVA
jgi:hypothetical protein